MSIVLITHPITAIFLFGGIVSLSIYYHDNSNLYDYLFLSSIIIASFVLASFWPYYSFFDLMNSQGTEFDVSNKILYNSVLIKIFPALIGIPIIVQRFHRNFFDQLALMFIGFILLYIYGGISQKYTFGRLISFIVLVLQISIADWISRRELNYLPGGYDNSWNNRFFQLGMCSFFIVIIFKITFFSFGYFNNWENYHQYKNLEIVLRNIPQYEVILSDIETSWVIPAFGGKIIAGRHAQAFVPDHSDRITDLKKLFSKNTTKEDQHKLLIKYNIRYILLNKVIISTEFITSYQQYGTIICSKGEFTLVKVD